MASVVHGFSFIIILSCYRSIAMGSEVDILKDNIVPSFDRKKQTYFRLRSYRESLVMHFSMNTDSPAMRYQVDIKDLKGAASSASNLPRTTSPAADVEKHSFALSLILSSFLYDFVLRYSTDPFKLCQVVPLLLPLVISALLFQSLKSLR